MSESSPQSESPFQQNISPVIKRLESSMLPLTAHQITRQVERVFTSNTPSPAEKPVDMTATLARLKPAERADRLYAQLMAYRDWAKESTNTEKKPFPPKLIERMRGLWSDPETKAVFLQKYEEANIDYVEFKGSQLGRDISRLEHTISAEQKKYQELTKTLFLGSHLSASDQMEVTYELEDLVYTLSQQKNTLETKVKLTNEVHTPENTDIVALHEQARLVDMRHQLTDNNFIWFDSMVDNYQEALMALTNGRWPLFIGEAGTGKSALAVATAKALTGEKPTLVACTSRTNEGHLIARMAMAGNETYDEYGAAMQAATGFEDSRKESEQKSETGRIVRLDELFKLGADSPVFAFLKELAQLKPGDIYRTRGILKGFKILATTNPSGTRYNNPEPNPALIREFAPIEVDYLKMNKDNPELYELMLASLMDKRGLIMGCGREELSPAYTRKTVDLTLPDGRKIIAEEKLIADPTDKRHGYLYRLAYALRSVQDSFIYGNGHEVQGAVLRTQANGTLARGTEGELLTLSTATITPGDVRDWLEQYPERRKNQHPIGKTDSLTEYLQEQLKLFTKQASLEDRSKLEALFTHFNLLDSPLPSFTSLPLTPKDIGYLSPRVPRPATLEEVQATKPMGKEEQTKQYLDVDVTFIDGTPHRIMPSPLLLLYNGKEYTVKSGVSFTFAGKEYIYRGYEGTKIVAEQSEQNDLCQIIDDRVKTEGQFPEARAEYFFGVDFIGVEAIRAMERKCIRAGIDVRFDTDGIAFPYSIDQLEKAAKALDTRERYLTIRPSGVKFTDTEGTYDGPITINVLNRLFKGKNPFGEGKLLDGSSYAKAFSTRSLQPRYAMPTKKIVPESRGKNWADQKKALQPGETRREAVEIMWDMIAYRAATGDELFKDEWDLSKSKLADEYIAVGRFSDFVPINSTETNNNVGTCPTR